MTVCQVKCDTSCKNNWYWWFRSQTFTWSAVNKNKVMH